MQQRGLYLLLALLLGIGLLMVALGSSGARAQTGERCFPETGYCISGRIREFWEQNGGLEVFGFPITAQQQENVEGQQLQVQWFQRNRLELHPENARPYDVLLGRLGVDRLAQQGRDWFTFAKGQQQEGCLFFTESGHTICEPFLRYWQSHGLEFNGQSGTSYDESLALFGLPLSEPMMETNSSGFTVQTQWFERARLEFYPENQPAFAVQLGLLGTEIRSGGTSAPAPTAVPAAPTPTTSASAPVPPSPTPTSAPQQPTSAPPAPTATSAPSGGNCDPAYPDVCIPSPPPDLDCGDIPYRRFRVLPPDPHNFDGDNNGIGCES